MSIPRAAVLVGLLCVASTHAHASSCAADDPPLLAPVGDDAPQITVLVDPPSGEVGLLMTVLVSVSGEQGADCALLEAPTLNGGRLQLVQGPSTTISTVSTNGRISRSLRTEWRFHFVAEAAGDVIIPPFRLNCRGEEVLSQPVQVKVTGSGLPPNLVTLELRPSVTELWVGQVFLLDLVATLDDAWTAQVLNGSLELSLPWLDDSPGLMRIETPPPVGADVREVSVLGRREPFALRAAREIIDGRPRITFRRTISLLATEAGRFTLPESRFSVKLVMETRPDRMGDPFGLFGDRRIVTRAAVVDGVAPGPELHVLAPPVEGRPRSFTNAVGSFRLAGDASPRTLQVGETCTLTLSLSGEGNLDSVQWPAFDELAAGFRVFGKSERRVGRTRVLEIQISPKNERVTEIPALELGTFDTETQRYDTQVAGPFPLTVRPGGEDGLVTLETAEDALPGLETIREELPPAAGARWSPWLLCAPGGLAWLAALVVRRRAAWRERNATLLVARGALPQLEQRLAAASEVREVSLAFAKFLSARLGGPPAGLGGEEAAAFLAQRDADLAQHLRREVARWEAAWLGGAPLSCDEARQQALALARRVEGAT
ncbi:MAG: BatD family protein [Planctomycetota bacterium]